MIYFYFLLIFPTLEAFRLYCMKYYVNNKLNFQVFLFHKIVLKC